MRQRSRFLLLCLFTCLFTLAVWNAGENGNRSSSLYGNFFSSNLSTSQKYFERSINSDNGSVMESPFKIFKIKSSKGDKNDTIADNNKTVILMWTKYYSVKDSTLLSILTSPKEYDPVCCSGKDILVTRDRSLLPKATVIVFFNYFGNLVKKDLPPTRSPDQLWVLFGKESPVHSLTLSQFPNLFNWTMSYRPDSDIYSPYGFTSKLKSPLSSSDPIIMPGDIPLSNWIANKTKILTGVVSHCPTRSKRERIIKALRNSSLPVDIFGRCGNRHTCGRTDKSCDHQKFWKDVAATYKFYFAAENALCVDYITEKFWRTLQLGMVPLVYGGGKYEDIAPPNSFVDVRQFKSPEEIANYLKEVSKDPVQYGKFFEWRRNYTVVLTDGWGGWCQLCRLAKQYIVNPHKMEVSPYKSYSSLSSWWRKADIGSKENACVEPPFNLPK